MERLPPGGDEAVLSAADHWAKMLGRLAEAEQVGEATPAEHDALLAAIAALLAAVRERQQGGTRNHLNFVVGGFPH